MDDQLIKFLNKAFTLVAVLIVGILLFFVGQMFFENKSLDLQNTYQITVSGEGKVYVKPDIALLSFGVTTQGKTVADITTSNTEKMNAVIAAVKKLGVEDKDIQTTNYNLSPNYEVQPILYEMSFPVRSSSQQIIGYTLEQNIQVKIRDFGKIGDTLSGATAAGANVVGSLQFTIDNPEQFKQEARAKAIAQAKSNAQNLSKESGISLGKLINVYENFYGYPMYSSSKDAIGIGGAGGAVPAPVIQPGQQEINVTINLTYQVK